MVVIGTGFSASHIAGCTRQMTVIVILTPNPANPKRELDDGALWAEQSFPFKKIQIAYARNQVHQPPVTQIRFHLDKVVHNHSLAYK